MKNNIRKSIGAILLTASFTIANTALAQSSEDSTTTTTTTTSAGTVERVWPGGIVIRTTTGTDPVRYSSSKTTTYVDENGNAVSVKTVKSGLPVTVYYTKVGDQLVASKVMVRKVVSESRWHHRNHHHHTAGTISEFGPQRIVVKTESSPDGLRYTSSKTTTYVDEDGKPVSIQTVKSGQPVTVYYTKVGNTLMATKVVVRKTALSLRPRSLKRRNHHHHHHHRGVTDRSRHLHQACHGDCHRPSTKPPNITP